MKRYSFIRLLSEKSDIGVLTKKINIVMDVDKSDHAVDRQTRHIKDAGNVITDKEIMATVNAALPRMITQLLQNMIDVEHKVLIKNTKNNLNVVVKLKGNTMSEYEIDCEVITVMVHKKFRNKTNTPVIKVSV